MIISIHRKHDHDYYYNNWNYDYDYSYDDHGDGYDYDNHDNNDNYGDYDNHDEYYYHDNCDNYAHNAYLLLASPCLLCPGLLPNRHTAAAHFYALLHTTEYLQYIVNAEYDNDIQCTIHFYTAYL